MGVLMADQYLVSCCNIKGGLLLVTPDQGHIYPILQGNTRGICIDQKHIWSAYQGRLLCIDRKWKVRHRVHLKTSRLHPFQNIHFGDFKIGPDANHKLWKFIGKVGRPFLARLPLRQLEADLHDVCVHKDILFLVLSKYNCVKMFQIQRRFRNGIEHITLQSIGHLRIDAADRDRRHINCVCPTHQGLLLSMFSLSGRDRDRGERWAAVTDGGLVLVSWEEIDDYIKNKKKKPVHVFSYETLFEGVVQPHSIRIFEDVVYLCESFKCQIWRISLENSMSEVAYELPGGYLRGLHVEKDRVVVGVSTTSNHPTSRTQWKDRGAGLWFAHRSPNCNIATQDWHFFSIPEVRDVYDVERFV